MSAQTIPNGTGAGAVRVIIVGAGFGGIAVAVELLGHGIDDITLLEHAPELGGTWHYNDYPGAACDVPSAFYSFSFAQRRDWSRFCSHRDEILSYLRAVAGEYGVTPRVVTSTAVTSCTWHDDRCEWTIEASGPDGHDVTYTCDVVILATGQLNQPALPALEGLETFTGAAFHSARWDHDCDLRGKRVAVIGTGASAVQFVPEIAPVVGRLTVFQRTGNWFLPRQNTPYGDVRASLLGSAALARLFRFGLYAYTELLTMMIRHPRSLGLLGRLWSTLFMLGQLRDRSVRRAVWPRYTFGCKRVLFSSRWLPALQRDNVDLVTEPIVAMTPQGPRTADGTIHEVDCVIYSTGFRAGDFMFPMRITGAGGVTLREAWSADGPRAHLGITVPGFPSMFVMYGPNTNTSGGSIVFFLEAQARFIRQAVQLIGRVGAVDVRPDVLDVSDRRTQQRFAGTAWTRCDSWYRSESGRNIANWPGYMRDYASATRRLDPAEFDLVRPR